MKDAELQKKRDYTKTYWAQQTKKEVDEYLMEASPQDRIEIMSKYLKEKAQELYRVRFQDRKQEMDEWKKLLEEFPLLSIK